MGSRLENDIQAIHNFDPAKNKYLFVSDKDAQTGLTSREVGFLGRIWMWICSKLGCNNASLQKVSKYIADHADQILPKLLPEDRKRLLEKIQKYNAKHPNAIKNACDTINKVATSIQPASDTPPKEPTKYRFPWRVGRPGGCVPPYMNQRINDHYRALQVPLPFSQNSQRAQQAVETWKNFQNSHKEEDLEETLKLMYEEEACKEIVPHLTDQQIKTYGGRYSLEFEFKFKEHSKVPAAIKFMSTSQLKSLLQHLLLIEPREDPLSFSYVRIVTDVIVDRPDEAEMLQWMCEQIETSEDRILSLINGLHYSYDFMDWNQPQPGPYRLAIWKLTATYMSIVAKKPQEKREQLKWEIDGYHTVSAVKSRPEFANQIEAYNKISIPTNNP